MQLVGRQTAVRVAIAALVLLAAFLLLYSAQTAPATAAAATASEAQHLGVASCAGTTCHGRQEATGRIVRQDELLRWQDESNASGAHSRAWRVLAEPKGRAIGRRLGIDSTSAPMCLGCHADPAPVAARGPRFQLNDGVGCEACHGAASGWISSHYAVGASHAANVAAGLVALEQPRVRAAKCLDCHWGSDRPGQFVNHRIMAAGHPRLTFELDLFTSLQQHHDEDADYIRRKGRSDTVKLWAIGQTMALDRMLSLQAQPRLAREGVFPEFVFLDCHSCHRRISDEPGYRPSAEANPARPIPSGMPPFNDENMILLSAAARIAAPAMAERFDADSRAFHAAFAKDKASLDGARARLRTSTAALSRAFEQAGFGKAQTFAILDVVGSTALAPRLTDYAGSAQAVMATDTLLSALVREGHVPSAAAAAIRPDIDRAYAAVRDPNNYRPAEFRTALGRALTSIRSLR